MEAPWERKYLDLKVTAGVSVTLRLPGRVRAGHLLFQRRGVQGHWVDHYTSLDEDQTDYEFSFPVPASPLDWKLWYVAGSGPTVGIAQEHEGRLAVAQGEPNEIVVQLR